MFAVITPAPYVVQNLSRYRAVTVETPNGLVTVNAPRTAYFTTDGRCTVRGTVKADTVSGSQGPQSIVVYHY